MFDLKVKFMSTGKFSLVWQSHILRLLLCNCRLIEKAFLSTHKFICKYVYQHDARATGPLLVSLLSPFSCHHFQQQLAAVSEEKKNLKALCTKTTWQMDSVVDKLVNIKGHLAAKEADISLRTWWRPKAELKNSYLPEVSLQILSNFTTSTPLPWVAVLVGFKLHHSLGPNAEIVFGPCVQSLEKKWVRWGGTVSKEPFVLVNTLLNVTNHNIHTSYMLCTKKHPSFIC